MLRRTTIALTALLAFNACRKDDAPNVPPTGPVTQSETNGWMLDSMRYFYLWNSSLPSAVDTSLSTTEYFASLKNTADRFSFLYKPSDQSTYPKYMLFTYGMDFSIIQQSNGAVAVVKLVIPNSVADLAGIRRGDYFTAIDGTTITTSNATSLTKNMLTAVSSTLTMSATGKDIFLPAQSLGENPIYLYDTIHVNGKIVAYLFYNYFNDTYNAALQEVFQSFKSSGATELILDLRYNPGGSVCAAALLNAMIAPGISETTGFAKFNGNNHMGNKDVTYKSALAVPESGSAVSYNTLADKQLKLARVFILSGAGTASAAELTINTLKPYTQVIQIGETTYGKDKGAVIVSDTRSPQRIPWTLMPITYNLQNAKGAGGYTTGITPDYKIDEMSALPLSPLGDNNDPLIAKALSLISGNGKTTASKTARVNPLYDSHLPVAQQEIVKVPISLTR